MGAGEKPKNETGGEPAEDVGRRPDGNVADAKQPVPLFLKGKSDGRKGDAQDEKDEAEE